MSRQPRIVRLTDADGNVLQSEITHPLAQAPQIFWHDVLCNDASVGSDDRRQPHDVVAATCADVRDGHPGLDAEELHDLASFASGIPLFFAMPDRADDVRDRAFGFRKGLARRSRWRNEVLGSASYGEGGGERPYGDRDPDNGEE